jgi:hypothetical protein
MTSITISRSGDKYYMKCLACFHTGLRRNSAERAYLDGENHDCVQTVAERTTKNEAVVREAQQAIKKQLDRQGYKEPQ